jgi:23S rRNA pseudouridine1911/1915/1917 synthase
MEWIIAQAAPLLATLKLYYPDSSNTTLRSWIQNGRVYVDSRIVRLPAHPLVPGQKLMIASAVNSAARETPKYAQIVYEDRYLTVVDKYAGALSVATDRDTEHTVHSELKTRYRPQTVYVIHRLDQGTSGLMVFARDAVAFNKLKEQLADHLVDRRYLAMVSGTLEQTEGTWHSYLYEDKNYYMHSSDNPQHGEEAITHYSTLAQHRGFSMLHVTLATGKKNQIRVHCQRAGHPVVGDDKYGGDEQALPRLALHAYSLQFMHPITKQPLSFFSPAPHCFSRVIPANLWVHSPITLAAKEVRRGR